MSRPPAEIDWKKVDMLLESHAPGTEVASHLGIHPETLYRTCEKKFKIGFSEYSRQKKEKGKSSVRVKQFQEAMQGDKGMLIWLGKNWLGQKENPQEEKEFDSKLSILLDRLLSVENAEEFNDLLKPKKE